ncbi:hypothetical protein TrLO_g5359 [Triparma laevis f. longispina]|uniref:Uncharacterized protein n=1 Tax=Triparma laevis f. longispina TaxID=1714387 RepID=A0A9W7ACQ6_9STRA|nr:hypothetical protein TrLO_g5359 [Triparma laevis f. longispina]
MSQPTHSTLQGMRTAPRDGHPRIAAVGASGGREVDDETGVIYYKNEDDEDVTKFKLTDDRKERASRKQAKNMERDIKARQKHSKEAKKQAWREGSQSPDRDNWDEDFEDLAKSVKSRPQSAKPANSERKWASSRPKSAHGQVGSISKKVAKLEETVLSLQEELDEARKMVKDTKKMQQENNDATAIDGKLAEKLALLRRDQERNVRVIEQLVKQRDEAQAKARRLEEVLVKEVESLEVDTSYSSPRKPKPSTTSPKKKSTQRPGESDSEFQRRIERRHRDLVKPFRSMEVHEAVRRRKTLKEEEDRARKQDLLDHMERNKRERLVKSMDAGEFSFAKLDRERQREKEAAREEMIRKREEEERGLLFKARNVKLYGTENWEDIAKREDAERKQRVDARATKMQTASQLPARMAMHKALHEQAGHVVKESSKERTWKKLAEKEKKATQVPRVNPDRYSEVMKLKQERWEEKLRAVKEANQTHKTLPNRELPIERRQKEYEQKRVSRLARDRKKEAEKRAKIDEMERIAKEKALASNIAEPKMTNAYNMKIMKLAVDRAKKVEEAQKVKKDEERRARKQAVVNAEVRQMVAEMERERKTAFPGHFVEMEGAKEKALAAKKAKEEEFKARQRALKDRLREVQKKHKAEGGIIGATEKSIMKQKAKRQALSVVADAVGWHARDELFDDAEKAYLGVAVGGAGEGGHDGYDF